MAIEFLAVATAIIACLFGYLSVKIEERHPALQFFFLIMSILTIIFTFIVMAQMAEIATQPKLESLFNGMYNASIISLIVIVLYYILFLIKEVLETFQRAK